MRLMEQYHLSHGLCIPDSFIAATASITGMPLFTFNLKDFRFIPEVRLYHTGS